MEDRMTNEMDINSTDTQSDIASIKEDIKNLVKDLKNLKDDAMESVWEEGEHLMESLTDIKDKAMEKSNDTVRTASWYVKKYPTQSMLYSFATGIMLTILLRK